MCSEIITEEIPEQKQFESHLTWIDDTLSELEKKEPNINKVDHVRLVLKMYNNEDDGVEVQCEKGYRGNDMYDFEWECCEESPEYASLFAKLINKCAKILYVEEQLDCIPLQLKELREIGANLDGDHKRLKETFEYCIQALEFSFDKLRCTKSENTDTGQILTKKWNSLQSDAKNMAVLAFLKSSLRVELQRVDFLKLYFSNVPELIELDPTYHIWHHNLYTSFRNIRKVHGFSRNKDIIMEAPYEKEIYCCIKQLKLVPHLLLSNYDMAILQKDILWMTVYKRQRHFASRVEDITVDVEAVYQKCLKYFDIALQLAKKNHLQKWILKIEYEKAETMIHVKDSETNRKDGMKILTELLETFPNDGILHFKVGRLYLYGVFHGNKVSLRDPDLAENHFKEALELKRYDFFPCIRDYVKSFKFKSYPLPVEELWMILQKSERVFNKRDCDEFLCKLRIWKAFVLWIYNPENMPDHKRKAAEVWLEAFGEFEDEEFYQENLFRHIKRPPFGQYKEVNGQMSRMHVYINFNELKNELMLVMNQESIESETYDDAKLFLTEIEKIQPTLNRFQHSGSMRSMSGRSGYQKRLPEFKATLERSQKNTTEADNDNNWRKK